ncbi:transposase [Candidatus Poribacteria bacterium]|nr:transposase [Candidatus Poribacteria bacterium]
MIEDIIKSLEQFQEFFTNKFDQQPEEAIEILLMLAYGHIFEIFTPNQLAETLGIDKNKVYEAIQSWSIFTFRKMYLTAGYDEAKALIQEALSKSPATMSRLRITFSVDDTVIDRLGNLISLTYSWFSGKHKEVVNGQNIIVITIKIGERVIPLSIRPVSKQGRDNTTKPDIFRDMLHEVVELFKKDGIDITRFPITFDSWYGSRDLVDILEELKFDKILIHAKSNYVFTIDGKKKKLSEHKENLEFTKEAWGCKGIPVARKEAVSPTFGKVILVFFMDGSNIKCVMVFGRKLRSSEAISIWKQHNGVEQFWRKLKNDLQIHRIRLRSRQGVYGMVAIKLIAYLVMEKLSSLTGLTFHQIKNRAKIEIDILSFFKEHFHCFTIT